MKHKSLLVIAMVAALGFSTGTANAQEQGQDPDVYPPREPRTLDVSGFSTECELDAPWVQYNVVTVGFTADPAVATITVRDVNGKFIERLTNMPLTGHFLYPGAAVDKDGNGTDWPGWELIDGTWVELGPDEGDAILRQGLRIRVDVNPTGYTTVDYPVSSPECANPPGAGVSPEQANQPQAQAAGSLPRTGGGPATLIIRLGILALLGGALALIAARRRTHHAPAH